MSDSFRSWGVVPSKPQLSHNPNWSSDLQCLFSNEKQTLAVGNGRSYGDSCLLSQHSVIKMTAMNRLIDFDFEKGLLIAEAGVLLSDLLQIIVPQGWFLPVTPGTSYVTLGGAVANDVHGKNHHCDGTIGRFIQSLDVLTSDLKTNHCSAENNRDLFNATIGGLGLTGVITRVEIKLIPILSGWMDVRYDSFASLAEFANLSAQMKDDHQYTVAWMDCATPGTAGRGVLMSANHSADGDLSVGTLEPKITIPFSCSSKLLNTYSIRAFNAVYYKIQKRKVGGIQHEHYQPYFYPLDSLGNWNRIYGRKGFHQYQFVVPSNALTSLSTILDTVVKSGMGSFLAVLKEFGDISSPGMLSFPRPGYCLALDFSERGSRTTKLIKNLDAQVRDAGGAAYPAKDKLMSAESFQQYFPNWDAFQSYVDPKCSSDFWNRVVGTSSSKSFDGSTL